MTEQIGKSLTPAERNRLLTDLSHFERLDLPASYAIGSAALERQYLYWSRRLHPDLYQLTTDAERETSLVLSSLLNAAYRTLADPVRRADYCLSLRGGPSAADQREMPPEFLEEILELRMALAEADDAKAIADLEQRLAAERTAASARIARHFADLEETPNDGPALRTALRHELNTIKFLDGLLRDLDEKHRQAGG